ncbi:MAG: HAMP domain-containing histidine kinase [Campylobacteraceae bacterium]|nr:HAMP domain-containing histidine kinase [Campylobacteraceae bacterium]
MLTFLALIGVFSFILYFYIKSTVYDNVTASMEHQAELIGQSKLVSGSKDRHIQLSSLTILDDSVSVKVSTLLDREPVKSYELQKTKEGKHYLTLFSPTKQNPSVFIVLKRELDSVNRLLNDILKNILLVNMMVIFGVLFFAFFLSRMILVPIKSLGLKLAKMNEKYLNPVNIKDMYEEFVPLGESLNRLIDRVQTFIEYRTELFIGIAHELKTPLAVMKNKNEVTLIKPRDEEYYKKAIKQNIDSIDEMNQMISAILEIGRQESEQLRPPSVIDLVTFIKEKATNFKILANQDGKDIKLEIKPAAYPTLTQPTLVLHVIQNFVQNAIKFSPENGIVTIRTKGDDSGFSIEVLDEGCGINEDIDLFAPFKRVGDKSGVGLGLFLAKGAAKALNAQISVENRKDKQGTRSFLFIPRQRPIK